MKEYLKKYREENPDKMAAYLAKRTSDPEKRIRDAKNRKNSAYKKKYGLSLSDAISLLEMQNGTCALCETALTEETMQVDHCHENGQR